MEVSIDILTNFKAVSISTKTGMAQFGKPVDILDEGRLFRIQDLHIIWKGNVSRVEREGERVLITYKNGDWIEVGIVEKLSLVHRSVDNDHRLCGRRLMPGMTTRERS